VIKSLKLKTSKTHTKMHNPYKITFLHQLYPSLRAKKLIGKRKLTKSLSMAWRNLREILALKTFWKLTYHLKTKSSVQTNTKSKKNQKYSETIKSPKFLNHPKSTPKWTKMNSLITKTTILNKTLTKQRQRGKIKRQRKS
jgi:hypothetical protein